jgi:hypothetical protein
MCARLQCSSLSHNHTPSAMNPHHHEMVTVHSNSHVHSGIWTQNTEVKEVHSYGEIVKNGNSGNIYHRIKNKIKIKSPHKSSFSCYHQINWWQNMKYFSLCSLTSYLIARLLIRGKFSSHQQGDDVECTTKNTS